MIVPRIEIRSRLKWRIIICLYILSSGIVEAQQGERINYQNRGDLIQFSKIKSANWILEKSRADSIAEVLNIPIAYVDHKSRVVVLQQMGQNNKPVYYATENIDAAKVISTDQVWADDNDNPYLTGEGIEINLWDGGSILPTHQEFQNGTTSRILMREKNLPVSNHSTHVAGTMAAIGINEDAKGMAGMATIYGWDFNNDIAEMSIAASDGMLISNHSYGPLCGWDFNTQLEKWYWYGDPLISASEDFKFGFYNQTSADLDYIAWCAPQYLIVKSAGNDRKESPASQPVEHYIWNESWEQVTAERDPDGGYDGYDCLTPMSVAKNILTVGAVDDEKLMTSFSAFGPTDDGRIKPDVVANGKDVYSSIAGSDNSYGYYDGTSMSAASASGSVALLYHLQNILQPGVNILSSTIKGLLIQTAEESGISPGPDYRNGWGLLNIKEASDLMFSNSSNGGQNIHEGVISQGEVINIPIETMAGTPFLKVTLCWIDPTGQPSSPSLNPRDTILVNDLDIEIENNNSLQNYLPWILDVENPDSPATHGLNHVDNVEQIYIADPGSEKFNIKISHSGTLSGNSQAFSLIISGISNPANISPPQNLRFSANPSSIILKWSAPESATPASYKIYRNDTILTETADTFYYDLAVITDSVYDYYVTAVYVWNNTILESLGTNHITACPRIFKSLPLLIDFENEQIELLIKNSQDGWRLGDSDSLGCYYLKFDDNKTKFIGTDSYSSGETSHVKDIASTAPLRLAEYTDVTISFDYMLVTGIYDAIDELHVVYKMQEEEQWTEVVKLPKALNWTPYNLILPEESCKNGTQIGFYYDDFYQWGMGAGLDNIRIEGVTAARSIDLVINSMTSPVTSCMLSEDEVVSINIKNIGDQIALPGDSINIQMNVTPGIKIVDLLILTDTLYSHDIFTHQMSSGVNLMNVGTYTFDFVISCNLDYNTLNDSLESSIEIFSFPIVQILNQDLTFCEDDQQALIEVSPPGGTLTGPGISGLYFDPAVAGEGIHTITYSLTNLDGCIGSVSKKLVVSPIPQPAILNMDLTFCEDDQQVMIEVSPPGGTLTGPGVSGLYFDPAVAGPGIHTITYIYTDTDGCFGISEKQIVILDIPVVDLGPDQKISIDDTIHLRPSGNGFTFLWFDGSTEDELTIIAKELGIGIHDIWVNATSIDFCNSNDSMLLTIDMGYRVYDRYNSRHATIFPNPFTTGFFLMIDSHEVLKNISIYGHGQIYRIGIPASYPYFNVSYLPTGSYILRIQTNKHSFVLRIIKI